ncbi:BglI family type II restriction endonuclease [Trueperella pyogenes]
MYRANLSVTRETYLSARDMLISDPSILIRVEKYMDEQLKNIIHEIIDVVALEFDAASILYPFWQNYPPLERGRMPIGNQYPWIEVGEHTIGIKIARVVADKFDVSDVGFPTGADQRFVTSHPHIRELTGGLTDSVWVCVDVKSAGPTDQASNTVMSPNQVSGSGHWETEEGGVANNPMEAVGRRRSHDFYPALPPLIVLPNGKLAITLTYAIKPNYETKFDDATQSWSGQPLERIDLVCIPNGLLLSENPGYVDKYEGLLFPGKDDKKKNPLKMRARVSFSVLNEIADWRHEEIWTRES